MKEKHAKPLTKQRRKSNGRFESKAQRAARIEAEDFSLKTSAAQHKEAQKIFAKRIEKSYSSEGREKQIAAQIQKETALLEKSFAHGGIKLNDYPSWGFEHRKLGVIFQGFNLSAIVDSDMKAKRMGIDLEAKLKKADRGHKWPEETGDEYQFLRFSNVQCEREGSMFTEDHLKFEGSRTGFTFEEIHPADFVISSAKLWDKKAHECRQLKRTLERQAGIFSAICGFLVGLLITSFYYLYQ